MGTLVTPNPVTGIAIPGLRRAASRANAWIDTHPALAFSSLTVFYAAIVTVLSSFKLLWLDELITWHIAKLGSLSAIWHALAQGADPNPPLTHLAVLHSMRLFGDNELALRLPAMLGYWVGIVSIFLFLKRRLTPTWAIAGTLLSMATGAFEYAYESRSYGIFYGLAMLATLCWSRTVQPPTRLRGHLAWAGMVAALALGLCVNYFSVLAFLPVAGGELVLSLNHWRKHQWKRDALRGSIRLHIWAGLALAATPLLLFHKLIQAGINKFAPHAWNKVSLDQAFDSYTEMVETVLYVLLALFVFAFMVWVLSHSCGNCRSRLRPRFLGSLATRERNGLNRSAFPLHESAAAFLFMAYPFLGFMVASVKGGMLSPRFVIPVCFGFAILGIATAHRIFGHYRYAAIAVVALLTAWVGTREGIIGYWYAEQQQCFYKIIDHFPQTAANDPIAIPDPLMVLTFQRYAPAELSRRVVFPVDFPAIRWFRHEDSPDQNLWAGRNSHYHVPIMPLTEFIRNTDHFIILAHDGNWLVEDLIHHRYPVEHLPINPRAGAIGGFTPLMHGAPSFFTSVGDRSSATAHGKVATLIPFHAEAETPREPDADPLPILDR